jgi:hypothetical protein
MTTPRLLLIGLLASTTEALTKSSIARRTVLAGAAAGLHSFSSVAPAIGTAPEVEGCLTCRLKQDLLTQAPSSGLAVGESISLEQLAPQRSTSLVDVIDVGPNPANFADVIRRTLAKHDPDSTCILVWVQSDSPDGKTPWCPDTRAALPVLERALKTTTRIPIVLVSADVVQSEYMSPSYPYRTDSQLRLQGVPTLYRWGRDGPSARLVERAITDTSVRELIRSGDSQRLAQSDAVGRSFLAQAVGLPAASAVVTPEEAAARTIYAPAKAANTQLAAFAVLPLLAYKASALVQGIRLQWYLDASIALAVVALVIYASK